MEKGRQRVARELHIDYEEDPIWRLWMHAPKAERGAPQNFHLAPLIASPDMWGEEEKLLTLLVMEKEARVRREWRPTTTPGPSVECPRSGKGVGGVSSCVTHPNRRQDRKETDPSHPTRGASATKNVKRVRRTGRESEVGRKGGGNAPQGTRVRCQVGQRRWKGAQ